MITLVTGSTGMLGNNVVRLLLEQGQTVRALVRGTSDPRPLAGLDVQIIRGDLFDAAALEVACRGANCVVHCAGHVHMGWSDKARHEAVNVDGTRNVARAAMAAGAQMIHVSTVDAVGLGTRQSPADEQTAAPHSVGCAYILSKTAAELVLREFVHRGLNALIVNPVYMLGPWDWKPSSGRMLLEVGRGVALLAPPGGNDFCDVRDVAAGILAAQTRGEAGRRYILGGHPLSYMEAWRLFASVTGARPPRGVAPQWLLKVAGSIGDLTYKISGREPDLNSASVAASTLEHHYSYARAAAELGYQVRPLEDTVRDAWSWFCEHGYAKPRHKSTG